MQVERLLSFLDGKFPGVKLAVRLRGCSTFSVVFLELDSTISIIYQRCCWVGCGNLTISKLLESAHGPSWKPEKHSACLQSNSQPKLGSFIHSFWGKGIELRWWSDRFGAGFRKLGCICCWTTPELRRGSQPDRPPPFRTRSETLRFFDETSNFLPQAFERSCEICRIAGKIWCWCECAIDWRSRNSFTFVRWRVQRGGSGTSSEVACKDRHQIGTWGDSQGSSRVCRIKRKVQNHWREETFHEGLWPWREAALAQIVCRQNDEKSGQNRRFLNSIFVWAGRLAGSIFEFGETQVII